MARREKQPKVVFKNFLEDNQQRLKNYLTRVETSEKYEREPWMLGSDPEVTITPETIVELNQLGDG
jgi:hypothetical protein